MRGRSGAVGSAAKVLLTGVLAALSLATGVVWGSAMPAAAAGKAAMRDLGTLDGASSYGVALNARGQIAGNADTATGARHAFQWSARGGMVDVGTLGGTNS